ncbi:MAG: glutaredoxin family protein [Gammaproteobacteria bacterium]
MAEYILFGTEGCHLCEEAEALLQQVGVTFQSRDILFNEQDQQRYGVRIPVLLHGASGMELSWPFSEQSVRDFVLQTVTG